MYELKKMERYLRVNLLEPDTRLMKKKKNLPGRGSTRLRNIALVYSRSAALYRMAGDMSYTIMRTF